MAGESKASGQPVCNLRETHAGSEESPVTQFAGGVVATVAQSLAMVPLEVVRQRQQVQTNTSGAYQVSAALPFIHSLD